MKVTYLQIEKALNNTFEFGIDGSKKMYDSIRAKEYEAIEKAGISKSQTCFTKSNWKAIHKMIKNSLESPLS